MNSNGTFASTPKISRRREFAPAGPWSRRFGTLGPGPLLTCTELTATRRRPHGSPRIGGPGWPVYQPFRRDRCFPGVDPRRSFSNFYFDKEGSLKAKVGRHLKSIRQRSGDRSRGGGSNPVRRNVRRPVAAGSLPSRIAAGRVGDEIGWAAVGATRGAGDVGLAVCAVVSNRGVAQGGHEGGTATGAGTVTVFTEGDVADVLDLVLDQPFVAAG